MSLSSIAQGHIYFIIVSNHGYITLNRKRMSVIVEDPEGKIILFTKGADNIMLARMSIENS